MRRGSLVESVQAELREAVTSLLQLDGEEDGSANRCLAVAHCLDELRETEATSELMTVRNALEISSSSDMIHLTNLLSTLMEDRVSAENLLPSTQDTQANEEAMGSIAAMTLTKTSTAAALLYSNILALPGALGIVDMQALSALRNVLRRWKTEVCGRESHFWHEHNESQEDDETPKIRGSGNRSVTCDDDTMSDSSMSDEDDRMVIEEPEEEWGPHTMIFAGLNVALPLCQIPLQKEFMSCWSDEAREVIIDAIVLVLATTQALLSGRKQRECLHANKVADQASEALVRCILLEPCDNSSDSLTRRRQTTVAILRGFHRTITMTEALPCGESGKLAAASYASNVLERFVQDVVDDIVTSPHHLDRRSSFGGSLLPSSAREPLTPKTPKMRVSLGGSSKQKDTVMMTSTPKLKSRTPHTGMKTPANRQPRPVLSPIVGMLQKLATSKGLEKAASRSLTVKTLHKCVEHLPSLERSLFLEFLLQLCRSKLKIHRLVGSELVGRILTEEWLWTEHIHESAPTPASTPAAKRLSISPFRIKNSQNLPVSFLLALQDRLVDRLPTVRAASANALAGIFSKVLEANENKAVGSSVALGAIMDAIAEEADDLLDCLRDRAVSDEKATVRRAAVGALVGLLVAGESSSDEDVQSAARITFSDAETLGELCLKDSSIQTRQAAAEGLTRILECCVESGDRSYSLSKIEKAWSLSTLTMVLDSENSCASKAKQLVERVVLYPILEDAEDEHTQLAWRVLATLVGGPGSKSETTSLRVVVAKNLAENNDSLSKLFKIIHRVAIRNLEEIAEDTFFQPSVENQRNGAWSLFEAVVGHAKDQSQLSRVIKRSKVDLGFLSASWDMMLNVFTSPETPSESKPALQRSMCKCLLVISKLSSHLDDVLAINVATDLKKMLGDLSLPVEIIGSAVTAMVATTVASAAHGTSENDVKQRCATHIQSLFQDCENEIAEHVGKSIAKEDETTLGRAFSTVGNISMLGYSSGDDGSRIVDDKQSPENVLRGLRVKPSMRLVELVQAFMADTVPGLKTSSTPVSVRAHALVTLGKFCLRDERLAKSALNILSRELHNQVWREGNSVTIQSNALLILGDLCVAYTNLVDRFLPVMAACLQAGVTDWDAGLLAPSKHNGSALVRKHAVVLLSNLLLQDYIKWRGLLFHRFLVASMDEDEDVAELAETALCGPLMVKQPKLFSMNFVESLFVLNRCTAHPIHDAASAMGDGGSGISVGFEGINLTGDLGRARRMSMYELMLSKMSDEDKIGVTARIAKEVLAGSLDHGNDLHLVCTSENLLSCTDSKSTFESSFNVMSDAFAILSSPCIRVGKSAQVEEDIEDPDLPNANNKRVLVSRGRLLSKISRKQMIETLLPILCNLKAVLQKSRSPLLKDLMRCLVDVFRRFNSEVKECLASDPTLLQEIAYDAQQFKKIGEGDNVLMLSHVKA